MKLIFFYIFLLFICFQAFSQETKLLKFYFGSNEYIIKNEDKLNLKNEINSFEKKQLKSITIKGFCDDIDTEEYNKNLSIRRVKSTKNVLIEFGVDSTLIKEEPKGEVALSGNENIEKQRAENRRVEISISLLPIVVIEESEPVIEKREESKPSSNTEKILEAKVGDKIALENILFYGNSHRFKNESFPALTDLLNVLQKNEKIKIKIHGHVCCGIDDGWDSETGTKTLSYTRAKAVYDYLIKNKIDETRLSYIGHAGMYPTGKGDEADKRVEVEITEL